jgi:hypothetical protein
MNVSCGTSIGPSAALTAAAAQMQHIQETRGPVSEVQEAQAASPPDDSRESMIRLSRSATSHMREFTDMFQRSVSDERGLQLYDRLFLDLNSQSQDIVRRAIALTQPNKELKEVLAEQQQTHTEMLKVYKEKLHEISTCKLSAPEVTQQELDRAWSLSTAGSRVEQAAAAAQVQKDGAAMNRVRRIMGHIAPQPQTDRMPTRHEIINMGKRLFTRAEIIAQIKKNTDTLKVVDADLTQVRLIQDKALAGTALQDDETTTLSTFFQSLEWAQEAADTMKMVVNYLTISPSQPDEALQSLLKNLEEVRKTVEAKFKSAIEAETQRLPPIVEEQLDEQQMMQMFYKGAEVQPQPAAPQNVRQPGVSRTVMELAYADAEARAQSSAAAAAQPAPRVEGQLCEYHTLQKFYDASEEEEPKLASRNDLIAMVQESISLMTQLKTKKEQGATNEELSSLFRRLNECSLRIRPAEMMIYRLKTKQKDEELEGLLKHQARIMGELDATMYGATKGESSAAAAAPQATQQGVSRAEMEQAYAEAEAQSSAAAAARETNYEQLIQMTRESIVLMQQLIVKLKEGAPAAELSQLRDQLTKLGNDTVPIMLMYRLADGKETAELKGLSHERNALLRELEGLEQRAASASTQRLSEIFGLSDKELGILMSVLNTIRVETEEQGRPIQFADLASPSLHVAERIVVLLENDEALIERAIQATAGRFEYNAPIDIFKFAKMLASVLSQHPGYKSGLERRKKFQKTPLSGVWLNSQVDGCVGLVIRLGLDQDHPFLQAIRAEMNRVTEEKFREMGIVS